MTAVAPQAQVVGVVVVVIIVPLSRFALHLLLLSAFRIVAGSVRTDRVSGLA
jgi:hypothetical protein